MKEGEANAPAYIPSMPIIGTDGDAKIYYGGDRAKRAAAWTKQNIGLLAEHDGCEQKTLGTVFHLEAATVTGILRRMEEAGLTERRIREGNRKSQYVFLTEHGKKVVQEIVQPILYGAETKALEGFTEEETERLIEYLRRIYCNMTKG